MVEQKLNERKVLRLRQLRREREMTQAELGNKVGLATASISAIENGTVRPSLDKALAIAAFFGRTVEELFEYVEVPA